MCVREQERRRERERNITVSFRDTSNTLDLGFFLSIVAFRKKYFWAWLATWDGDLVVTNFCEIPFQSPLPSFFKPIRNILCSSSVHRFPEQTNNKVRYKIFYKLLVTFMFNTNFFLVNTKLMEVNRCCASQFYSPQINLESMFLCNHSL